MLCEESCLPTHYEYGWREPSTSDQMRSHTRKTLFETRSPAVGVKTKGTTPQRCREPSAPPNRRRRRGRLCRSRLRHSRSSRSSRSRSISSCRSSTCTLSGWNRLHPTMWASVVSGSRLSCQRQYPPRPEGARWPCAPRCRQLLSSLAPLHRHAYARSRTLARRRTGSSATARSSSSRAAAPPSWRTRRRATRPIAHHHHSPPRPPPPPPPYPQPRLTFARRSRRLQHSSS